MNKCIYDGYFFDQSSWASTSTLCELRPFSAISDMYMLKQYLYTEMHQRSILELEYEAGQSYKKGVNSRY